MNYFVVKTTLSLDTNLRIDLNFGATFDHSCKMLFMLTYPNTVTHKKAITYILLTEIVAVME